MDSSGNVFRSVLVCFALALSACGGGGYSDDSGTANTTPPPPPPSGIGPAGGTVNGPNGSKVEIPPNALTTNTAIAITQTSTGSPPLPGGFSTSGAMFAFTPHGTTFALPVTITLPFDPATVPAGSTPALFKTNAQNQWEQVTNATFGATSVTAQISSFSFTQILRLTESVGAARADYSFSELIVGTGLTNPFPVVESGQESGRDFSHVRDFGSANFDTAFTLIDGTLIPNDQTANGVITASADGGTFQVFAEAPLGNVNIPGDVVAGLSQLVLAQTFIKREQNATLTFTMPITRLEMHDENSFLGRTCPPGQFCFQVGGVFEFKMTVSNVPSPEAVPAFYQIEATAQLGGVANHWTKLATTSGASMFPVWNDGLFDFRIEDADEAEQAKAVYTLRQPLPFEVPLSHIQVGEQFNVRITVTAFPFNRIAGPPSERATSAGVYLNFPDSGGGGGPITVVTSTGLEQVATLAMPEPPPPVLVPPAPCVPGPASAGVLQFSADGYSVSEDALQRVPTITVTRTGGSSGAVTATFSTVGGTAINGTDFTGVTSTVFFADGDDTPRVAEVPILDDAIGEPSETVIVELSQPGGCAVLGARSGAVLTILDDDSLPAPSGLDPTFDTDGKATLEGFGGDRSGMAVQPDGKIVMVGGTFTAFVMARFNADGSLDRDNFGDDGTVTTNFNSNVPEEALDVAIQPDNKIVVVGRSGLFVALARYLPDGTPDDTFGVDGKALTSLVGRALAVALQPDGKIIIAGDVPSSEDFLIARFGANGLIDASFAGGSGFLTSDINGGADLATSLVLQPDGSIVISGPHTNVGETVRELHTGLMRVDANGVPDNTFGTAGNVLLTGVSVGEGLVRQSTGKFVLAGSINAAVLPLVRNEFLLMRLGANGTPDDTFGTAGKVQTQISTLGDEALAVALQADGKIVAAGRSRSQVNSNFAVARYSSEGVLDTTFANGGKLEIDFFGTDIAENVVVQSNGKIVLGGIARINVDGYGVARVNP